MKQASEGKEAAQGEASSLHLSQGSHLCSGSVRAALLPAGSGWGLQHAG